MDVLSAIDFRFVAFIAFSTIAIVSAILVPLKKNPVSSAFSLILVLFSFAGVYAVMGAHFVATLQILIYTGAVMVLFVFVIMLLNADQMEDDRAQTSWLMKSIILLGAMSLGSVLIRVLLLGKDVTPTGSQSTEAIDQNGGNVLLLSQKLFSDYFFHFELISFLILTAIVGIIALVKRKAKKEAPDGV